MGHVLADLLTDDGKARHVVPITRSETDRLPTKPSTVGRISSTGKFERGTRLPGRNRTDPSRLSVVRRTSTIVYYPRTGERPAERVKARTVG